MISLISEKKETSSVSGFKVSTKQTKSSSNTKKNIKTISYNPAKYMKKIASANSIVMLSAIKGSLYAQISSIKHSGASEEQVLAITGKMWNAIRKADTKINSLTLEEKMKKKKEAAKLKKEKSEKEKAKRIEKALKQRKQNRKAQEYNDVYEAEKEGITTIEVRDSFGLGNEYSFSSNDFTISDMAISDSSISISETSSIDVVI